MSLIWPRALLREQALSWWIAHRTVEAGPSISLQSSALNISGGGLWKCAMAEIDIRGRELVLMWEAVDALMDGGAALITVPRCAGLTAPWPVVDGRLVRPRDVAISFAGGGTFDLGTGFGDSVIRAAVAAPAGLRATSLSIAVDYGGELQAGQHFAIDHPGKRWRMYRIARVLNAVPDGNSGAYEVEIRPPLRAAVVAGEPAEFDMPRCQMRLASPDGGQLSLQRRRMAQPNIEFVEAKP